MSEIKTNRTLTSKEIKGALRVLVNAKRPAFIWGQPGVGKSAVVAELCKEFGGKLYDIRLSQCEPTDLRGMPFFNHTTGMMEWAPPVDLPTEEEASKYPVVFLFMDEMNSAAPNLQASAYQLVLDRKVGTYTLPDNVFVIAAGNRDGDRGVTYRMAKPLSNRMVHFEMRVDNESWVEWAILNNIHPDVVGFIQFSADSLNSFDPKSPDVSFATPRTWEYVSDVLYESLDEGTATNIICGTIGEGTALKFMAHRKFASNLPDPMEILKGKVTKLQATEISACYSLMNSMLYLIRETREKLVKENNEDVWDGYCDNMLGFMLDNFQEELTTVAMRTAMHTMQIRFNNKKMTNFRRFFDGPGQKILASINI